MFGNVRFHLVYQTLWDCGIGSPKSVPVTRKF